MSSCKDATLARDKWLVVGHWSGPHSADLMAILSNAMMDKMGTSNEWRSSIFPYEIGSGCEYIFIRYFQGDKYLYFPTVLPYLSSD